MKFKEKIAVRYSEKATVLLDQQLLLREGFLEGFKIARKMAAQIAEDCHECGVISGKQIRKLGEEEV